MKRNAVRWTLVAFAVVAAIVVLAVVLNQSGPRGAGFSAKRVVINEAVHTLLYLPLYHAQHQGYFTDEGLQVEIVTGGTATNSFAAMLSGEAQFSQADPMYVPISREQGSDAKVVAQVVGRIAVWGLSTDPQRKWETAEVRDARISTHPRPMTAYVYTREAVKALGLNPDTDVDILQGQPGTELAPLLNGQAQFAFTLEPGTSQATSQGASVVYSFPQELGDRVFTGLLTKESYISHNRSTVLGVVRAYQRALDDLHANPENGLATARAFFPQLDDSVLRRAIERMLSEEVIPTSVLIPDASWQQAIAVRVAAGDLTTPMARDVACDLAIMKNATE